MLETRQNRGPAGSDAVMTPDRTLTDPPRHEEFAQPSGRRNGDRSRKRNHRLPRLLPGLGGSGGSGGSGSGTGARGRGRWRGKEPHRSDGEDAGTYDLRNTWQVAAGAILIPVGVVIILLAWYGAAHARVVQQQIPYMVSGGFIGLGCMIVGGLLFFGHWLYRLYDQADLHHEEQLKVLTELVRAMADPLVAGAMAAPTASAGTTYFATSAGSVYHLAGCPVMTHHTTELRTLRRDELQGRRPCQICLPDLA